MMLRPAFSRFKVIYATTDVRQGENAGLDNIMALRDYNQSEPLKLLIGLVETFNLVRKVRPSVVISTGAAPGLLCMLWGRLLGAKVIWIDSIANSEKLSLSGRIARRLAVKVVTQWEHLASDERVEYWGSVL